MSTSMSTSDFNNVTHHRWDQIPEEPLKGTITRRLITGDRMMLAHVYLKKGDDVPRHSHENEQLTYILEGALQFWFGANDERELTVRAGEVLVRLAVASVVVLGTFATLLATAATVDIASRMMLRHRP